MTATLNREPAAVGGEYLHGSGKVSSSCRMENAIGSIEGDLKGPKSFHGGIVVSAGRIVDLA